MAPYWVSVVKSEETLKAALVQVDYMVAHVIPNLCARSGHDLRLCLEMAHKGLSAQLELRAGLERRESRGNTYRPDFPYRDDEGFLCYLPSVRQRTALSLTKYPSPRSGRETLPCPMSGAISITSPVNRRPRALPRPQNPPGAKRGAKNERHPY